MKTLLFLILLSVTASVAQKPLAASNSPAQTPFNSIASIGAVVPPTARMGTNGKWNAVGVEQANQAVAAKALNQPAKLSLKVQVYEAFKEGGWAYRIMAPDGEIKINGTKVTYRIWAYFRPDQAEALTKVRKGSTVVLSGRLGRADIQMIDGHPALSLDLYEAKVENQ